MHKTFTRRSAVAIIGGELLSVALPVCAKQFETKSPVTGKTIYTYLFDINDKNNDKMSGYDYE